MIPYLDQKKCRKLDEFVQETNTMVETKEVLEGDLLNVKGDRQMNCSACKGTMKYHNKRDVKTFRCEDCGLSIVVSQGHGKGQGQGQNDDV